MRATATPRGAPNSAGRARAATEVHGTAAIVMGRDQGGGTGNTRGTARGAIGSSSSSSSTGTPRASGGPVTRAAAARSRANDAPRPSMGREDAGTSRAPRASDVVNNSASGSLSRDSDRSAGSPKGAGTPMGENARNGDVGSPSKKRKRIVAVYSRRYVKRFKGVLGGSAADVAVASPDRVGKENTSSGHVADSNTSKLYEGSGDAACEVPRSPFSGLHETSGIKVNQNSAPFSEVQPRKPTNVLCPQTAAAESSLPVKAGDPHTAPTRQSCLSSSSQSVPISFIHHEEIKSTLGGSEPVIVQKEDSASGHVKVMPSDETDGNSNICGACGSPGTLRSCDGKSCQSRYHISCLDPSLEYLSPGIWFCTSCTKKRFQFGLHSIVDGIESVWDVKEAEGMQNSKQYFVNYKNLAHVHNRWVLEDDINVMPGGPDALSLFNKRNHTEKAIWKEEWTKPHRLLRKRLLMPPKLADDFFSSSGLKYSYCNVEWLVKWRGLGYDHATWELETLPCLCTPEADELKKNYEYRREVAKRSSITTKAKVKQSSFKILQRLPDGCHPYFDNDHLCSINLLREFWYKSRGAVLVDDKEFVIKTVLFTLSVLPDVSQPILIVTSPASLSLWEVQFNNLAPFINVVVYDGGKDNLKLIQDLEFYESGSSIMLQVLLSHADAVLEDIEPIARIDWEAVIVDYSQKSTVQHLEQLKQLSSDFRMLLVSSPIKEYLPEYRKLLGFLNSGEQENGRFVDAEALVMSKVNFKSHIAYERPADSSKILEHWVPAYISQLQLEIYCSILLSNSSVLQSKMKSDGSLCDIIISLSKCCDHPYLVDEFLQNSHVDHHDRTGTLDTRVQACGKLRLLQNMLIEIRNKRLRVIILFQSGVAGGNSIGGILEGVVCDSFGHESYERVESGAPLARKQAAVNMFNDKTKGRFVFLIESRACLPSIKLLSVDVVIIYNSDCNPLNDLKAIQRIKIESQKYPGIFRLYTPFTMEEKQLVLAKHGVLTGNYKDMPHSLGHSLVSWGALSLFTRFDELQHDNYASKSFERDTVILEFLKKLATNVKENTESNCVFISKANMSGEFYSRSITLIGESGVPASDGDPSNFWLNLLDGKSPRWSNLSEPQQSRHRMLQNIEELARVLAEEARRMRTKVDGITVPSSKCSSDNSHDDMLPKNCSTLSPPLQQLDDTEQKEGMKKLTTPKNLHVQLKKELSKLIKVLQLPDNAKLKAEQFFEYYLNNHLVLPEPVDILRTFNIALCWRAASHLNYKVDRRESLALAEKGFNCEYNEALVGLIYKKLRTLKKKVPDRAGEASIKGQPVSVEDTQLSWQENSYLENDHMFQNKKIDLHGNFIDGAPQEVSSVAEQMISEGQESVKETHKECHMLNDEPPNMIMEKSIDLVENVFSIRKNNILCKQQLEISGLVTHRQNNVIRLKEVYSLVLEHIRRSHIDEMTRSEKIKLTAQWFSMLIYAFLEHMKLQHGKLEGLQSDTWSSECQLKEKLHQVARSGQLDRDFDRHIALPDSNFVMEEFIHFEEQNDEYHIAESSVSDCQQSSNDTVSMEITLVRSEALSEPISIHAMENEPVETSAGSGVGPALEAVDFQENNIHCSSDGISVQRAGCSWSTIPANDDSTGQESLTSECRNTEHIEICNITKSDDEPAEAERAGTLGAIAAQDLQPEMHSLTTHVEPSLDPHGRVESAGMVTAHDLQAEILPSASVPTEQSTSPAQQSLATSGHSPAEAEQADILGTETTCSLQPSQGEVQLSTTMQDQPAEVQACTLGAIAARSLQPETQPSTSTQSAPFERTYLVGMPVLRSHSARAESTRTLGSLIAHNLHSELHPLASMQDRPAEAEGAVMLGSTAAQDLQPERQSSTTVQHVPLERVHSEERIQIGFQPNMVPGTEQPTQHPPVTALVFNNPILSDEPLKNELERLMHCSRVLRKDHEHKKSQLLIEYNQEREKITKKYDLLSRKEDSAYLQNQRELSHLYRNVFVNKSLAENFRRVFTPSSAAQGRLTTPVAEQSFEFSSAAQTTTSPSISSSAIRPPGSYVRPSFVALPPSSSSWNAQLPGNLYGTASSPFVPAPVPYGSYRPAGAQSCAVQPLSALASNLYRTMPPAPPPHLPHGSYRSAAAQLRAPSPHLQQLRMPSQYAMHTDQQQRHAASGAVPLLGQYGRGSYASTVPQGGAIRNSMDPSSAHQASSSRPPHRASLLPPRRHPESMLSLQPSTSNPIFMPAHQPSSYPSMALGGIAGPQNAAPGSQQHGGAQIAGVNHNQPGSKPSSYPSMALGGTAGPQNAAPGSQQHGGAQIASVNHNQPGSKPSSYPSMALGGTAGPQNAAPGSQQHGGAQIAGVNHNQPGSKPSSYPSMALGGTAGLQNAAPGSQQHGGAQIAGVNHNQPGSKPSSYPSMALGGTAGPQNAAPGSQQHGGAQIACVNHNQPGSEPASMSEYLKTRLRLVSSPAGAGSASPDEVVCLSDDEP